MPDKKLTDAEIVKALKQCKDCNADLRNSCNGCLLLNYYPYCTENGIDLGVDLINRLQAENKKNENIIRLADKTIATLQAENERLKKGWKADIQLTAEVKVEAYKEFAEKLREKVSWCFSYVSVNNEIDNLLKELVGDK